MKNLYRSILVGAICLGLTFCLFRAENSQAATAMPDFSLENVLDGTVVESKQFAGKALLITFFATWCPPCIEEIPSLIELQNQFQPAGFSVVALSVDQGGPEIVSKLVKKKSINYPVLMADAETMQNFGGVYGIPVSFLVNKKGNVVKKYTGYISTETLTKDIESVMN